jgi:sec-independent protein translocase protein TatB
MSFSETIFLFLIALLVFGPKKLPEIARQIGKALNEFKRASNEIKAQIEAEVHQLEVQEREKQREEEEQKLLLPAEPPPGTVASTSSPLPESSPDSTAEDTSTSEPPPSAEQMNPAAEQTTHA